MFQILALYKYIIISINLHELFICLIIALMCNMIHQTWLIKRELRMGETN